MNDTLKLNKMELVEKKAEEFALKHAKKGSDYYHTLRMSYTIGYTDRQLEEIQEDQKAKTELFADFKALQ